MTDEQRIMELISLCRELITAGNYLATELVILTQAAQEAGSELPEAEVYIRDWANLLCTRTKESLNDACNG